MARIPEVGDIIDDVFRVEEQFDQGNFGAIYRVYDQVDDRQLALKVLKPGPHDEDEVRQRFEREARLIYRLEHPHIVKLRYYGETDKDLPYMAMEFLHGTDLKRILRGGYEMRDDQIQRIGLETLSALEAAHEVGIVHRDLKPANIFIVDDTDRGHVKVLDFGFAKSVDDSDDITTTGTLVGSPAYMAPEMVHKDNVGPHSDLYSMGLILGEMITGEKIVQIENVYDTIVFQAGDDPIEVPEAVANSPFAEVIDRAIQKPIDRRYGSAAEMRAELEALDIETADAPVDGADDGPTVSPKAERESEPTPLMVEVADDEQTAPRSRGFPALDEVDTAKQEKVPGPEAPTQEVSRDQLASLGQGVDAPDDSGSRSGRSAESGRPDGSGSGGRSHTEKTAPPPTEELDGPVDASRPDSRADHPTPLTHDAQSRSGGPDRPSPQTVDPGDLEAVSENSHGGQTVQEPSPNGRTVQEPSPGGKTVDEQPPDVEIDLDRPTSSRDRNSKQTKSGGSSSLVTEILLGVGLGLVGLAVILVVFIYLK